MLAKMNLLIWFLRGPPRWSFFEEIIILDYSKVLFPLENLQSMPDHVLLRNANRYHISGVRMEPAKAYEVYTHSHNPLTFDVCCRYKSKTPVVPSNL